MIGFRTYGACKHAPYTGRSVGCVLARTALTEGGVSC